MQAGADLVGQRGDFGSLRIERLAPRAQHIADLVDPVSDALAGLRVVEVPIDFVTTSCTPSASKIARIGPPAMMPVPVGAARRTTRPAPK